MIGKFRSQFSKSPDVFNSKLFNADENKKIYEYVVDYFKEFKSPNFELIHWEYNDKPHTINKRMNRINIKNKKIRDNYAIKNIVPLGKTYMGELILRWLIKDGGKVKVIERNLYIPEYKDNQFLINGNVVLPVKQMLDTIYSVEHKNKVAIKSFSSLTITKNRKKYKKIILNEDNEQEEVAVKKDIFDISIFGKEFSPMVLYYPIYGFKRTFRYFALNEFMEVIPRNSKMLDFKVNDYYHINDNLMLEVAKCMDSRFIESIVGSIVMSIPSDATYKDIEDDDPDFWYRFIGTIYSASKSKNTVLKKGRSIVNLSFKFALDSLTKDILDLPEKHKKNSWAIVRYMMFHFNDIIKKKHDIKYKRVRLNEYIALGFIHSRDDNMHTFVNSKSKNIKTVEKLFSFKPEALIKSIQRKKDTAKLIRYNPNINDLQAINLLRISQAGPQGITGSSFNTSSIDYYPSYLFNLDPNAASTSSPGVTSLITPFTELDEKGYFHSGKKEPRGRFKEHLEKVEDVIENNKDLIAFKSTKRDREASMFGHMKFVLKKSRQSKLKPLDLKYEYFTNFKFELKRFMKSNVYHLRLKEEFITDPTKYRLRLKHAFRTDTISINKVKKRRRRK